MKIKATTKTIYYFNKLIYSSDQKIDKYLFKDDKIILLLDNDNLNFSNENVIAIDLDGNFLWKLEKRNEHNKKCPCIDIYIENDLLKVYKSCGIEYIINLHTGKIIFSELKK